jgi:2,4-dienoyl-CoA reductase (NADPH2)
MKIAEEEAHVDMISIVIGWHEARTGALGRDLPADNWVEHAQRVKDSVAIPVAFGVRLRDPVLAEQCLKQELFDFWEVCRPFLADPQLLHKLEEDRLEEVKPCLAGLTCLAKMFNNLPYLCTVNPALGHEAEDAYQIRPARIKKKILVVGGGPAGLECASISAQRGHEVIVYERGGQLGGQLLLADREPSKGKSYMTLLGHYKALLKRHSVQIRMNSAVDEKVVRKEAPDVVVLATGAWVPRFTECSPDGAEIFTLEEALLHDEVRPLSNVLIVSGERAGLVAAEYLSGKGCRVSIVEEGPRTGTDVGITFIWRHRSWIKEMGVREFTNYRLREVKDGKARLLGREGEEVTVDVDVIIQAGPRRASQELERQLRDLCDELYLIGDAVIPRSLTDAIHEGYKLGTRV